MSFNKIPSYGLYLLSRLNNESIIIINVFFSSMFYRMEVTSRGNIMYVMLNICTTPLQLAFSIVTFVNNHLLNLYASIGLLFLHLLKYVVKHLVVGCAFIFVTLWTSVLMYSTFYLMYVPSSSVVRPVHFTFR